MSLQALLFAPFVASCCGHVAFSAASRDHPTDERSMQATPHDYPNELELESNLLFRYRLDSAGTNDNDIDAISIQMVYKGLGWISFAVAADEGGKMTGGEAIIGIPGQTQSNTNPGKYNMDGRSLAALSLMEEQSLIDASIVQNTTSQETILTFTKLLEEPGEHTINATESNANNTFMWAVSNSNFLSYHSARKAFKVNLKEGMGSAVQTKSYKSVLAAHGIMAVIGWAILSPVAIAASWLRDLLPPGGTWFHAHRSMNFLCFVFTAVAFILAVTSNFKRYSDHSPADHIHFVAGWVIMFVVTAQVIGGVFRPHASAPPIEEEDEDPENVTKSPAVNKPRVSRVRRVWEVLHKGAGVGLMGLALWQMFTGIKLWQERYQGSELYQKVFWGWVGAFLGMVVVLKVWSLSGNSSKRPSS